MIVLDSTTTNELLPFDQLVPALRQAFQAEITVPLRHNHSIKCGVEKGITLIMPAWDQHQYMGIKTVNIFPNNREKNLPGLHSTYLLFDGTTGQPLANIDGDAITSRRTAAASALAASYLARKDASRLLVVGSGQVAAYLPAAYGAVRDLTEVLVWNYNPASGHALVEQLQQQGVNARWVDDLEHGVRAVDMISCATLSEQPLIRGSWLQPGQHLDLIGSFTPTMIESDPDCFKHTSVFVDTDEAPMKAGDLLEAFKVGALQADAIQATLFDLCLGHHCGRRTNEEVTVFKAVGNALEDLAAAVLVYESHTRS
ncbi:ornithine cyclodeaminase [Paenalcaligenes hominis]|uniref:Ornithine cyclodeaminase n=1 Tax=Paenalcaligenes hominis TaxID=643674 RepID=A0A1U9K2H8_9BURK|nr:ornithine cyclodeaminase family protein [Paenalcaligenes hominis]AQS52212.1 ornithine cyclodeaminase [Paenalcaligenes hominis]